MRLFMFPLIAIGLVLTGGGSHEPSEAQMREAFTLSLARQVAGVLDFVAETSGSGALESARSAKADQFEIVGFRKSSCAYDRGTTYSCTFSVEIALANGVVSETLTGGFRRHADGRLSYASHLSR